MSENKEPKILFVDIETYPTTAFVWGAYDQNIIAVREYPIICSYSAKWQGEKAVTRALPDCKGYKPGAADDSQLVKELWHLLNEADIVVAHNGRRFDIKR